MFDWHSNSASIRYVHHWKINQAPNEECLLRSLTFEDNLMLKVDPYSWFLSFSVPCRFITLDLQKVGSVHNKTKQKANTKSFSRQRRRCSWCNPWPRISWKICRSCFNIRLSNLDGWTLSYCGQEHRCSSWFSSCKSCHNSRPTVRLLGMYSHYQGIRVSTWYYQAVQLDSQYVTVPQKT